jgi:cyanophycinase-like exopeptidase
MGNGATAMTPGLVVVIGSGETAASGRRIFHELFSDLSRPIRVAILETPAGFEPNSPWVAGQVADFLRARLRNFQPEIAVAPARKRGTSFSPDDPAIIAPMYDAHVIYMGAGSPTYAARQLRDSLAWRTLTAKHRLGASLVFASASALAISAQTIPVYEIYKVGQDVHWTDGLNLFGAFGLSLAFVPHWNNRDGGENLDTSRCFMGRARFAELLHLLPADVTVVGIEEHTGFLIDVGEGCCRVVGRGGVAILREGEETAYQSGQCLSLAALGPFQMPPDADGVSPDVWARVREAETVACRPPSPEAPADIWRLAQEREAARSAGDWVNADAVRERIQARGWHVRDTPEGPGLAPLDYASE